MAKKTTDSGAPDQQKLNDAAEQLKKAAELLSQLNSMTATSAEPAAKKTPAKKSTTAKKPASKSTSTKKPASKSTAAKSTTAKKAPAKKEEPKEEPVVEEEVEEPVEKKAPAQKAPAKKAPAKKPAAKKTPAKKPEPVEEPVEEVAAVEEPQEEPKVEEPKVEEKVEEPVAVEEPKAEEPKVEEPKAEEKAEEPVAAEEPTAAPVAAATTTTTTTTTTVTTTTKQGFAGKADNYIKGKGKFLIFIIVNALFVVSSVMLLTMPISITVRDGSAKYYSLFSYYGNGDVIKANWAYMAGEWANGGYALMGILMFLAFLLPLALVIKNIVLCVKRNKDFSVYKADAIIFFAFMLFYNAMINLYGANVTFGVMFALIIAAVDLAFVLFTLLVMKDVRSLPFFSLVNILLAMVAIFLLTGPAAKLTNGRYLYAANAAEATAAGGYFIMLLISIALLITLIIMQVRRLPRIVEIIIPLAAAALAVVSMVILAPSLSLIKKPAIYVGAKLAGGYVFGAILTILIAIADTLFTFMKPLQKYRKMVDDSTDGMNGFAPAEEATTTTTTTTVVTTTTSDGAAPAEAAAPAAQAHDDVDGEVTFCPDCGAKNAANSAFCKNCGHRLD